MLENFINGLYFAGASANRIVLQTGGKVSSVLCVKETKLRKFSITAFIKVRIAFPRRRTILGLTLDPISTTGE